MPSPSTAIVVGGGISGVACAAALNERGIPVRLIDRGRALGGRMASRTLRDSGTPFDGHVSDIGAAYFTVSDDRFRALVDALVDAGIARPWTDTFHLADSSGVLGVKSGPMRFTGVRGIRSIVEHLAGQLTETDLIGGTEVSSVVRVPDAFEVDGERSGCVAVCMPGPQALRILAPDLVVADLTDLTWEPVIAVTIVFASRDWPEIDGVFVNDDPVLTWIADDGRRRGDGAPVLVAHVHPVLSAGHLDDPSGVIPAAVASVRRILGIGSMPDWVQAHRWSLAKPTASRTAPFGGDAAGGLGFAGDGWHEGPRVEAAWLSGRALGAALASR